jgi:hypothetical protein
LINYKIDREFIQNFYDNAIPEGMKIKFKHFISNSNLNNQQIFYQNQKAIYLICESARRDCFKIIWSTDPVSKMLKVSDQKRGHIVQLFGRIYFESTFRVKRENLTAKNITVKMK